jgi:hypothetical protein
MNVKITLGVVLMITLATTIGLTSILQRLDAAVGVGGAGVIGSGSPGGALRAVDTTPDAPPAITGDNIYVAWWTNKTGNNEVMCRASTDAGKTFGDKINLSNTTDTDSTRVEIDSDADNVVVTWWETNDTSDVPVMRVSDDNGKTFGPLLKLATNGTIGN